MTLRLLPFARSKRAPLAAAALLCYAAAIVIAPGGVRSQLAAGRPQKAIPLQAPTGLLPAPIAPENDAFAPRAALDDGAPAAPPAPALPPLPRVAAAPATLARSQPATHVSAIATGAQPTAVIDDGGATRVVGLGAALDGSTIERIDETGIELANGRRLLLEPGPGR